VCYHAKSSEGPSGSSLVSSSGYLHLGLYEFSLNGEITKRVYPRLKYKKKLGSHIVNPKADEAYVKDQENKYLNYYKELSYKLHEVQNVQGHNNLLRKS